MRNERFNEITKTTGMKTTFNIAQEVFFKGKL